MPRYDFVSSPLIENRFARALLGAGEQAADHHRVGARSQGFGDIAGIFDAAVGDDRHVVLRRRFGAAADGGDLRHADAGDDARRANRTRADADFDDVDAGFDQRRRAFGRGHVAAGKIEIRITPANLADDIENIFRMAMRRIDGDQIHAGAHQALDPLFPIGPTPTAAPTRKRPRSSLQALGY